MTFKVSRIGRLNRFGITILAVSLLFLCGFSTDEVSSEKLFRNVNSIQNMPIESLPVEPLPPDDRLTFNVSAERLLFSAKGIPTNNQLLATGHEMSATVISVSANKAESWAAQLNLPATGSVYFNLALLSLAFLVVSGIILFFSKLRSKVFILRHIN